MTDRQIAEIDRERCRKTDTERDGDILYMDRGAEESLGDNMSKKEERLRQKLAEEETKGKGCTEEVILEEAHTLFVVVLLGVNCPPPAAIRAPSNPLSLSLHISV